MSPKKKLVFPLAAAKRREKKETGKGNRKTGKGK
jgi:hypothetical protein